MRRRATVVHGNGFSLMCGMKLEVFLDFCSQDIEFGLPACAMRQPISPDNQLSVLVALHLNDKLCDASSRRVNFWIARLNQTHSGHLLTCDRREAVGYAKALSEENYEIDFFPKDEELRSILESLDLNTKNPNPAGN